MMLHIKLYIQKWIFLFATLQYFIKRIIWNKYISELFISFSVWKEFYSLMWICCRCFLSYIFCYFQIVAFLYPYIYFAPHYSSLTFYSTFSFFWIIPDLFILLEWTIVFLCNVEKWLQMEECRGGMGCGWKQTFLINGNKNFLLQITWTIQHDTR